MECPICYLDANIITNCNHNYCTMCYIKINDCALCREPLNKKVCNDLFRDILYASGKTKTKTQPKEKLNAKRIFEELKEENSWILNFYPMKYIECGFGIVINGTDISIGLASLRVLEEAKLIEKQPYYGFTRVDDRVPVSFFDRELSNTIIELYKLICEYKNYNIF